LPRLLDYRRDQQPEESNNGDNSGRNGDREGIASRDVSPGRDVVRDSAEIQRDDHRYEEEQEHLGGHTEEPQQENGESDRGEDRRDADASCRGANHRKSLRTGCDRFEALRNCYCAA
jgi:hypothetical protein